MMRRWWIVLLLLLAPVVQAATVQAFLDRNHVSLGDTVTLNLRVSDGSIGNPDLAPLQGEFQVLGTSRSSSVQIVNGKATQTSQLGIALKPLHAGTLTIPALDVGGARTQPLTLKVGAAPVGGTGKVGDPVFMQASMLSTAPYVGQQTVYTLRLFYLPGVNGALGDPTAKGARLVKLDRDHRYTTDRNGYTYKVIERSWALIPQRSGSISVVGPSFQGQQLGMGNLGALLNNPNALLNNPNALLNGQMPGFGKPIQAAAPTVTLDARATPANAGKPWLPARNVQLKLTGLPANGQVNAGAPLTLTLSISASGQPADALPEPALPPIPGARVYPDQTQDSTDASGQWLQGTRTRSFAIVPERNGKLAIPSITLNWWNVTRDHAEQASLPAYALQVSGVATAMNAAPAPTSATSNAVSPKAAAPVASASEADESVVSPQWRVLAVASLALWLVSACAAGGYAWWRRRRRARHTAREPVVTDDAVSPPTRPAPQAPTTDARSLQRRALEAAAGGDAAVCEHAMLAWARAERPAITHLGMLMDAVADPVQRNALDALQRARWQGGDASAAAAAVARAFARGIAWRAEVKPAHYAAPGLPPLYPS